MPFLGNFWAHFGDKQPPIFAENNTFWGPLLFYFVEFSATWQPCSRLGSLKKVYMHNLAHRCLYPLQLSNFLMNDFASSVVRKPHQFY